jgi:hypothetical protein
MSVSSRPSRRRGLPAGPLPVQVGDAASRWFAGSVEPGSDPGRWRAPAVRRLPKGLNPTTGQFCCRAARVSGVCGLPGGALAASQRCEASCRWCGRSRHWVLKVSRDLRECDRTGSACRCFGHGFAA